MEKNSNTCQSLNSFHENELTKHFGVMSIGTEEENIVSRSDLGKCPNPLNNKSSKSDLVNSIGMTDDWNKEMLAVENHTEIGSYKLGVVSNEDCQLKGNISENDCKEMDSRNIVGKNKKNPNKTPEMKDFEGYSTDFSEIKEGKIFELETNEMEDTKDVLIKGNGTVCENSKEALTSEEYNQLMELPNKIKENAVQEVDKDTFFNDKETIEEPSENGVLLEEKGNEDISLEKLPNEDIAFANYFDITIPRIGKHVFQNNERPCTNRYDLAIEQNERRFNNKKQREKDDEIMKRIEKEKSHKKYKVRKQKKNIKTACYVTKLCSKILEELSKDRINERKIICNFKKILHANITPTGLLYVPHLVYTICFIRGTKAFSKKIRLAANECYNYCHAMFPVPFRYNFETVYTSEVRKFLPDCIDKMESFTLDYGNIDDILENSDDDDEENTNYNSESYNLV